MQYNPFEILKAKEGFGHDFGLQSSFWASTLNSSISEKLSLSYLVLKGSCQHVKFIPRKDRAGVLDWLGLGLTFELIIRIDQLIRKAELHSKILGGIIKCIFVFPVIGLAILHSLTEYIIKPVIAAALTVAVALPIILLMQPFTRAYEKSIINKIDKLAESGINSAHKVESDKYYPAELFHYKKGKQDKYLLLAKVNENTFFLQKNTNKDVSKTYNSKEAVQQDEIIQNILRIR